MHVDGRKQNIRTRKWGVLTALLAVFLIATYVCLFWFQTVMLIETRYLYRSNPIAHVTLVELSDNHIARGDGSELSSFGYNFEVPWQDVDTKHIQRSGMVVLIPFRSGLSILVGHGSTHDLVDCVMNSTRNGREAFRFFYGDSAVQSDYEFLKLALNTTPSSIRLTDSKKDVVRKTTLMVFKTITAEGDSGIFEVKANEFRGFQYGDPNKHPKRIRVAMYSPDGGIEISFSTKDRWPLAISQADINRAIQTLRYSGTGETGQSSALVLQHR